jgi:hypothetical protein
MSAVRPWLSISVLLAWVGLGSVAHADGSFDELAKEITRLRGAIDDLEQRAEDDKEAQRTQLRALAQQRVTLETDVQREQQRREQLAREVERISARGRTDEARVTGLKGVVLAAIERFRPAIDVGVPFRRDERRAAIDAVQLELVEDRTSPHQAFAKLWKLVEQELALTRSLSVESQVITLEGREVLADVARAGTVLLYFRAPDGRLGTARHRGEWAWEVARTPEESAQIAQLFAALEGRQRAGFFVLPAGLAPVVKTETESK